VVSADRRYRYLAISRWDELYEARRLGWVILHPGHCHPAQDVTLARIRLITLRHGFTACHVASLYALRLASTTQLRHEPAHLGEDTDAHLHDLADCEAIVCAWGRHPFPQRDAEVQARAAQILEHYRADRVPLLYLGHDTKGRPLAPLDVPADRLPSPIPL
jgi:hypothetical protein